MWLDTLIAYSLQITVVIAVGLLLPVAFRVEHPKVRLAWLQLLFAACILAPLWQPSVQPAVEPWVEISVVSISAAAGMAVAGPVRWLDLAAITLGAGALVRLLWLGLGMFRLRRYRENARRLHEIPEVVSRLQSRLGVRPDLYLSKELESPLTFGWRPSIVLLPDRFPEMSMETQQAIVCHELLHVRRRDWLMTLFEESIRSLFWFHPAVRWLITEIQLVREQVVDRDSVEMTCSRQAYLEALLEAARLRVRPNIALAPSFLGRRQITKRVEVLLKEISMSKFRFALSAALMVVLIAGVQWFSASSFPLQGTTPPSTQSPETSRMTQRDLPADDGSGSGGLRGMPLGGAVWGRFKWGRATWGGGPRRVYRVQEDGVVAPSVLHKLEPSYTDEAREAKLEGTCVLEIEIGPDGRAYNIQVMQPLGLGLDEAAIEAIDEWIFQPGLKDGEPVTVRARVEVNFRLL